MDKNIIKSVNTKTRRKINKNIKIKQKQSIKIKIIQKTLIFLEIN